MSIFQRLWVVSFLVTTSNFTLYLLLAAEVLIRTNSTLLASSVFASQWVLPVLLVFRIEQAGRVLDPRWSMLSVSLIFAFLSAATLFTIQSVLFILAICALFGALESFLKAVRLIALKLYFDSPSLKRAVASLSSAMYIGSAFAGLLFATIPNGNRTILIVAMAVCAHLVGVVMIGSLPKSSDLASAKPQGVLSTNEFLRILRSASRDARVFDALFFLIIVCAVFQGFHNIARTALPLIHLDAGDAAVGVTQLVAATAILLGVLLYRIFFSSSALFLKYSILLGYACSIFLIAPMLATNLAVSLACYFVFILLFEFVFIHYQTEVVLAAPAETISVIASFQYAVINLAMLTTTLAGGALVDAVGLLGTACIFSSIFFVLAASKRLIWHVAARGALSRP